MILVRILATFPNAEVTMRNRERHRPPTLPVCFTFDELGPAGGWAYEVIPGSNIWRTNPCVVLRSTFIGWTVSVKLHELEL